jgi:hypothetical protein
VTVLSQCTVQTAQNFVGCSHAPRSAAFRNTRHIVLRIAVKQAYQPFWCCWNSNVFIAGRLAVSQQANQLTRFYTKFPVLKFLCRSLSNLALHNPFVLQ